jgi:hypothetical protein
MASGFERMQRRWTVEVYPFFTRKIGHFMQAPREATSVLRDRTPKPPDVPLKESEVQWGGPSAFDYGRSEDLASGPSLRVTRKEEEPPPPDPEEDPYRLTQFDEVERKEKTVRITGTNGAYVDFARIEEITFRGPDDGEYQQYYRFTMKDFGDQT